MNSLLQNNFYKILPFTKDFLDDVMQVEMSSFKEDIFPRSVFEDLFVNPNIIGFVAIDKHNKVAGYIMLRYAGEEAEILTIAVDKPFLKQGIGTLLMKYSLANLVTGGIKEVFLEVRPSNLPAINLYNKFGAKKVGERPNYYENEDAFVYMLKLE